MADDEPKAPKLVNVPNVEIADVGYWDISNATDWHPTAEDLAAAVDAMTCPAVRRPTLKFGHTGVGGEGDPAIGSLDNLRLSDNGQTLIADYVGIPAWLGETDENGNSVLASAYPDRSGEFQSDYQCQLGHTHPFVVRAMALLGVVNPGIGTLESLLDLYAKAPMKEKTAMASTANAGVTADKLRSAYYQGPAASDYNLWIREVYVDPPELIVQDDNTDTLLRVAYTVNGDEVEFAEGQSVKVEYVAARAKLKGTQLMAFASKGDSRPGSLDENVPASASGSTDTDNQGGAIVATLMETLRDKLGLPADASEEDIAAAYEASLETPPDETEETTAPTAVQEQAPEGTVPVAAGTGLVQVDKGIFDQLTQDAAAGRAARDQQVAERREQVLSAAVSTGRVAPSSRDFWAQRMAEAPDSVEKILSELPVTIPVAEIGHSNPGVMAASVTEADVKNTEAYKGWEIR